MYRDTFRQTDEQSDRHIYRYISVQTDVQIDRHTVCVDRGTDSCRRRDVHIQ